MNLQMKPYKIGDENNILDLFQNAFNKSLDEKYWQWRYTENPINEKYINLMWDNKILAGHYAVCPVDLKYFDKVIKTGFSMTTMTHKDYGKRGIFTSLAKELYDVNYDKLQLIWGFPNNNSVHGFIKNLNWKLIDKINMMQININEKTEIENSLTPINEFDKEFDCFFERVSGKFDIIVKRDSDYLNWRYVKNPVNKYYIYKQKSDGKLDGYVVYKLYQSDNKVYADIVDILADSNDNFKIIIENLLNILLDKGIAYANIWMKNYELEQQLVKIGFKQTESETYFGAKINSTNMNESVFDINKWYITMGDSDVF